MSCQFAACEEFIECELSIGYDESFRFEKIME